MKVSCIQVMREKLKKCRALPYFYQLFNEDECPELHSPMLGKECNRSGQQHFRNCCSGYSSFEFPILPVIDGGVKHCSYSELEKITDFKTANLIHKTHSGRLFRGTITKGSEKRPVIVKTWDFLHLIDPLGSIRPLKFCDEIELYETASAHPYLVKLSMYCCERRLAAVYEEEFFTDLFDVLLDDAFGWDNRMRVATQLADLLAWLHEKRIAVGSITASCIIINAEENIKVFDFGAVYYHVNEDSEIPLLYHVGREAPEVLAGGKRTMKSDVYIFGLLLMELIMKREFVFRYPQYEPVVDEVMFCTTHLVHKSFEEVDDQTASDITELTCRCLDVHPDKRPSMKTVFDALGKLSKVRGEPKRDENEAETE